VPFAFVQGGYSSHMVVDQDFVLHVPNNISLAGAAPLMCAGITVCAEWALSPLMHLSVMFYALCCCFNLTPCCRCPPPLWSSSHNPDVHRGGCQVYSPLRHYGLDKKGMKVGVVGLGGLGHMCVSAPPLVADTFELLACPCSDALSSAPQLLACNR
jgi:hypothetical protein